MFKLNDLDCLNSDLMPVLFKNCISVDVETTGTDPVKNGIVAIGACNFSNRKEIYIENKIRPDALISDEALNINGFTRDEITQSYKIDEYSALCELIDYANENKLTIIVGKNPNFDYNFLKEIWLRNNENLKGFPFSYRVIDVTSFVITSCLQARNPIPEKGFSSEFISNILDIEQEPKPHNALSGARMNKLYVYSWLDKYC
jgi:DNA polymerase III alpha subunit (gram-positive type)